MKYAHKLNDKVLHPQPIEKRNVNLAERLFHESTIDALEYDASNGHPEWKKTVAFLKVIRRFWNIFNVKNPKMGQKTKDPVREPISHDDYAGLEWLRKFADWTEEWKALGNTKHGLSKETLITCLQTTRGLIGIAMHLLDEKGFQYVLFGFINSDPIERRFGWYRQLCDANYFLSVQQFLECEKKIRLQTLIKFGKLSFSKVIEILKTAQSVKDIDKEAESILTLILEVKSMLVMKKESFTLLLDFCLEQR